MSNGKTLATSAGESVLQWAAERRILLAASLSLDGRWSNLRAQFYRYDSAQRIAQITFPIAAEGAAPAEIPSGEKIGISFRRGHKKCIFVGQVVMRKVETDPDGGVMDTLLLRVSEGMRELQRRVYRRVTVPHDRFIAVKVWEGGTPSAEQPCWPLCSGRLGNISVGGLLLEIRADQNPRLTVGDHVGVEITANVGRPALLVEAQYRHCCLLAPDRLGLGLQFIGLEHDLPGRSPIEYIADFVRTLQRETGFVE